MRLVMAKKTDLPVQLWRWDSALLNEGQLFSSAASLRQKTRVPVPYNIGNNRCFLEMPDSCKKHKEIQFVCNTRKWPPRPVSNAVSKQRSRQNRAIFCSYSKEGRDI